MVRIGTLILTVFLLLSMLPVNIATASSSTVTIFSEDFEGDFGQGINGWELGDHHSQGPTAKWGKVDSSFGGEGTHSGNFKAYCAAQGYEGTSSDPTYPLNTKPYMRVWVDLTNYSDATLGFWMKMPSVGSGDFGNLEIGSPAHEIEFGKQTNWWEFTFDLTGWTGREIYIEWSFQSDGGGAAEGWYIDDILISGTLKDIRTAQITSVETNKSSYQPNDPFRLASSVKNTGNTQLHLRVVAQLKNPNGETVYDSHSKNDDFDLWLDPGQEAVEPEFSWQIPQNALHGTYQVTVEVRDWDNWNILYDTNTGTTFQVLRDQPIVVTLEASGISKTSATLNGRLDSTGGLDSQVWFEYGTSTSYGNSTGSITKSVAGSFSNAITNLQPDTTYHFRACANNGGGTVYGADMAFTTGKDTYPPQVATNAATDVRSTSATLNSDLTSTGGLDCLMWFKYGTSTTYGYETPKVPKSSVGPFSVSITNLMPNTTYHFRAHASNDNGTGYGVDRTFTTGKDTYAPEVTTVAASGITKTSASLNGSLDSTGGLDSRVWFEYGTSMSYGNSTEKVLKSSAGPFSEIVSGLMPNTTYHYRACASNGEGSDYGADRTFTTPTESPSIPAAPSNLVAVALSPTSVKLTWQDNSDNEEVFKIERYTGVWPTIDTVGAGITSYIDDGSIRPLTPGETYRYRVLAYNSAGNSESSNVAEVTLPTESPSIPAATIGGFTITIYVVDSSTDSPLAGVNVSIDDHYKGDTNTNGRLEISGITKGEHRIEVRKYGYSRVVATGVIDSSRMVDFSLSKEGLVLAPPPGVEPEPKSVELEPATSYTDEILAKWWSHRADILEQYVSYFEDPNKVTDDMLEETYQKGKRLYDDGIRAGITGDVANLFLIFVEGTRSAIQVLSSGRGVWESAERKMRNDSTVKAVVRDLKIVQSTCQTIAGSYQRHDRPAVETYELRLSNQVSNAQNSLDNFLKTVTSRSDVQGPSYEPYRRHYSESIRSGHSIRVSLTGVITNPKVYIDDVQIEIKQYPEPELHWLPLWRGFPDYEATLYLQTRDKVANADGLALHPTDSGASGLFRTSTLFGRIPRWFWGYDEIRIMVKSLGVRKWTGFWWWENEPIESATLDINITVTYATVVYDEKLLRSHFEPFVKSIKKTLGGFQ